MNDILTGWRKSSRSAASGGCVEVAAGWRKSSFSAANGNCVEVGTPEWRKSTRSGGSNDCVEVASSERIVGVRDTKQHGTGPVLGFPGETWRSFLREVKSGQRDY